MDKVYVVFEVNGERGTIVGVFDTKMKANMMAKNYADEQKKYVVQEVMLNQMMIYDEQDF
jgi:hypothetical protein